MSWLQFIYTRLNLDDLSPKVISDYTNVLTSTAFIAFLEQSNIKYKVTNKIPEMLNARSAGVTIILTNQKEIPAFINKEFTHKQFTFADIPLNGEVSILLKDKTDKEIVALLNYMYSYDQHLVITKNNLKHLSEESLLYSLKQELEDKLKDVRARILNEATTETTLNLGRVWGRVMYLSNEINSDEYLTFVNDVDSFSNTFFLSGKMESAFYASTPKNPKTVDRILSYIKRNNEEKIALLCFDCMGYAEWFLLRDYLEETATGFSEVPLFTLMPSVTKYARTAIFHGSKDVYSVRSPGRADEAKAFASFYDDKHTKYFTEEDEISSDTLIGYDCISILYSFFDDLSHSTQFPPKERSKALYFKAIKAYLEKTTIAATVQNLQDNNFVIYICSDHGSVVSYGNGQRLEKYLVDSFAKRAAIVPKASASLVACEKISVPFQDNILLALPEGRSMFANKNQIEINHGGITLEEMVVPFIKVQR